MGFRKKIDQDKIYYWLLIVTVLCLPLSKMALSISMILLIANWLIEADFKRKYKILYKRKCILIFTMVFFVHLIWLINTKNFGFAFNDISNKAILILYPIIIGTSKPLTKSKIKKIIVGFVISVLFSTLIGKLCDFFYSLYFIFERI